MTWLWFLTLGGVLTGGVYAAEHEEKRRPSMQPEATRLDTDAMKKPTVADLVRLLREQLPHQRWDVSRGLLDRILAEAPPESDELSEALLISARYLSAHYHFGESILLYEHWLQAVNKDDDVPKVLVEMGIVYREVGAIKTAVDCFYRAMRVARQQHSNAEIIMVAQWQVAETSYQIHDWERSRRLFEMFTDGYHDDNPLTQTAYYRMGDCSKAMGFEDQAIVDYVRALSNNDENTLAPEARFGILEIALAKGNDDLVDRAVNDLSLTIARMAPIEVTYWKKRSGELLFRHLFEQRSDELASRILDVLDKLDADSAWREQIAYWRGILWIQRGEWNKAVLAFQAPHANNDSPGDAIKDEKKNASSVTQPATRFMEVCKWISDVLKKQDQLHLPDPVKEPEGDSTTTKL